jgi:hypothetical protein
MAAFYPCFNYMAFPRSMVYIQKKISTNVTAQSKAWRWQIFILRTHSGKFNVKNHFLFFNYLVIVDRRCVVDMTMNIKDDKFTNLPRCTMWINGIYTQRRVSIICHVFYDPIIPIEIKRTFSRIGHDVRGLISPLCTVLEIWMETDQINSRVAVNIVCLLLQLTYVCLFVLH